MRARHLEISAAVLALLLLAACTGNGDGDTKSSAPSRSRSTTTASPVPVARTEVAGARWDGKIAVGGGFPDPSQSTDRLDLLDLSSGTWSTGPTLPHRYDHSTLAELGG
ncbi:MAG TPA: kelch repeat-containing protein, partial [Acidimicrobiia bacterium]|nr:kelch repeat-containing protein [Acidimicrobiia bacterium]